MIQEATNSIVYQRRQNGWSKKSIWKIKDTTKPYETDYEMPSISCTRGRRNVENFDVSMYLCVYACVRALTLAVLRVLFPECSADLVMSLHDIH
jgi:hypothetical protein